MEDCGVHLVHRTSAQLGLPGESCIPVSSNNADMVKFESSQDATFQTLVRGIKECVGLFMESDDDEEQPAKTTNPDEGDKIPLEIATPGVAAPKAPTTEADSPIDAEQRGNEVPPNTAEAPLCVEPLIRRKRRPWE